MGYVIRSEDVVIIDGECILTNAKVAEAIAFCNSAIKELNEQTMRNNINIFAALGLKNLSGLVGEYFVQSVYLMQPSLLQHNLHQDGYPDLCLVNTEEKLEYFNSLRSAITKEAFSPYRYGGIEIKATCGSTPSAKKVPKPLIGVLQTKVNS